MGKRAKKLALFIVLVIVLAINFIGFPLLMADSGKQDLIAVRETVRAWEPYSSWPRAW